MNPDLPQSLESRAREWIDTPPQYRASCPACGARYGFTPDNNLGFMHRTGCWVSSNAHELVFGTLGKP